MAKPHIFLQDKSLGMWLPWANKMLERVRESRRDLKIDYDSASYSLGVVTVFIESCRYMGDRIVILGGPPAHLIDYDYVDAFTVCGSKTSFMRDLSSSTVIEGSEGNITVTTTFESELVLLFLGRERPDLADPYPTTWTRVVTFVDGEPTTYSRYGYAAQLGASPNALRFTNRVNQATVDGGITWTGGTVSTNPGVSDWDAVLDKINTYGCPLEAVPGATIPQADIIPITYTVENLTEDGPFPYIYRWDVFADGQFILAAEDQQTFGGTTTYNVHLRAQGAVGPAGTDWSWDVGPIPTRDTTAVEAALAQLANANPEFSDLYAPYTEFLSAWTALFNTYYSVASGAISDYIAWTYTGPLDAPANMTTLDTAEYDAMVTAIEDAYDTFIAGVQDLLWGTFDPDVGYQAFEFKTYENQDPPAIQFFNLSSAEGSVNFAHSISGYGHRKAYLGLLRYTIQEGLTQHEVTRVPVGVSDGIFPAGIEVVGVELYKMYKRAGGNDESVVELTVPASVAGVWTVVNTLPPGDIGPLEQYPEVAMVNKSTFANVTKDFKNLMTNEALDTIRATIVTDLFAALFETYPTQAAGYEASFNAHDNEFWLDVPNRTIYLGQVVDNAGDWAAVLLNLAINEGNF